MIDQVNDWQSERLTERNWETGRTENSYDAEKVESLTKFSEEPKNSSSIWSKPLISHHKLRHAGDFFERIDAKCLLV